MHPNAEVASLPHYRKDHSLLLASLSGEYVKYFTLRGKIDYGSQIPCEKEVAVDKVHGSSQSGIGIIECMRQP